ncbi:MAG TPA: hypothetical protein VKU87_12565 [Thermomicrobiaceae bacterium]|nr:hypothetical protein [Thermomicrobiaceae bacterium]
MDRHDSTGCHRGLGVRATNIYGLSEIIGPGVSQECVEARDGAHLWEDHFLAEVVDPESGEPLPDGDEGELVITTLTKEAMPLIRYRTGDRCSLNREPCACGRTHVRMSMIRGRTDDMLIIRGINVYPTQIEAALQGIEGIVPHYQLVVTRDRTLDEAELQVEVAESLFDAIGAEVLASGALPVEGQLTGLRESIDRRMRDMLGLRLAITLLAPGAAPRSEGGKLRRVSDQRQI